jgi:hypothetical protein
MVEMKKNIVIVSVVFISASVSILLKRNNERNNLPHIVFEQSEYDFDTLFNQSDAEFHFVYENIGGKNLSLQSIKTSCGCTIPDWKTSDLAPTERDSFKVTYDIENKGYFFKEIMVYSNSKTSPDRLIIKGYVLFEYI